MHMFIDIAESVIGILKYYLKRHGNRSLYVCKEGKGLYIINKANKFYDNLDEKDYDILMDIASELSQNELIKQNIKDNEMFMEKLAAKEANEVAEFKAKEKRKQTRINNILAVDLISNINVIKKRLKNEKNKENRIKFIKAQLRKINATCENGDWRNKIKFQHKSEKDGEMGLFDMYCNATSGQKRKEYDEMVESVRARKKRKINETEFVGMYDDQNEYDYDFGPYCICRLGYNEEDDEDMIECSNNECGEWYHTICMNMSDEEYNSNNDWLCPKCSNNN